MSETAVPEGQQLVNDIHDDSTPNVESSDLEKHSPLKTGESIAGMSFKEIDEKVKKDKEEKKKETVVMPLSM